MRADDDRTPFAPLAQIMQNLMLRAAIYCRKRIIEKQNFRI
ncbi:Uncharacterised protein [Salmonella enterica subsp. enterica serovar Typhimurium str. DT104]|nr:Uncharacterised protein [Salmonella enterica subsp. enterica serovar Typhimurium str. DT104]